MKKLTICAAAVTAIFGSQVHAGPGDVHLMGHVAPVCEVTGLDSQRLNFTDVTRQQDVSIDLTMRCNDIDGATVSLTSSEGGLESDDNEDFALTYTATFAPTGLDALVLNAPGGPGQNDVSIEQSYPGSEDLATGVYATLAVQTTEQAIWAGGYSDTLTVNITSN